MFTTQSSLNSSHDISAEPNKLSLDPSKRELFIEMLHKKDMKKQQFLELHFGNLLIEKKVRDRAIADRIESIKQSHI